MAVIERLLSSLSGRIVNAEYLQDVKAIVEVDSEQTTAFIDQLTQQTQGFVFATKYP